jgi:hypothetical protein
LSEAGSGKQSVANALATLRFFQASAFMEILLDRLPGAAIADSAVRLAVWPPETTDVADALACRNDRRIGKSTLQGRHLEWKASWRSKRIGEDLRPARAGKLDGLPLELRVETGFLAECSVRPDAGGTKVQNLSGDVGTGQPKRRSSGSSPVRDIARPYRLALVAELQRTAGIVPPALSPRR